MVFIRLLACVHLMLRARQHHATSLHYVQWRFARTGAQDGFVVWVVLFALSAAEELPKGRCAVAYLLSCAGIACLGTLAPVGEMPCAGQTNQSSVGLQEVSRAVCVSGHHAIPTCQLVASQFAAPEEQMCSSCMSTVC